MLYTIKKKMPFLGKLIDGIKRKRKQSAPSAEEAINNLRDIEDLLAKKQTFYEDKISAVMMKIEAQRTALEGAGLNMEVLGVLDQTTKALQIANQNFDLDKVRCHTPGGEVIFLVLSFLLMKYPFKVGDLMDSIAEDLQLSDEFASAISQPIGDVHDEDELLKELEELEKNVAALSRTPGRASWTGHPSTSQSGQVSPNGHRDGGVTEMGSSKLNKIIFQSPPSGPLIVEFHVY
ncbi:SNF7 family protein [Ostertagia ostertagi]